MEAPPSTAPSTVPNVKSKPLRQMLGRGLACNRCRTRKVKCDGLPICSSCFKSGKLAKELPSDLCIYETIAATPKTIKKSRPSTLIKPTTALAPILTSSTSAQILPPMLLTPPFIQTMSADPALLTITKREREREIEETEDEENDDYDREIDGMGFSRKRIAGKNQRVEILVDRITELEKKLEQVSTPKFHGSHLHTHIRSVAASPPYHQYHESVPMDSRDSNSSRRSMSYSESDTRAEFAAMFPQESSLRSTERQSGSVPAGHTPTYASFMPPLAPLNGFDDEGFTETDLPSMRRGQNGYSSQEFPALNYSPGLGLHSPLPPMSIGSNGSNQQPVLSHGSNRSNGGGGSTHSSLAASPEELSLDPQFLRMILPGWPISLPTPAIVHHLVIVFFNRAIVPSSMLNKARLLEALKLDPLDPRFPSVALLHAICAFASVFCSAETLGADGCRLKYWESEKSPREYHFACAREEIDLAVVTMSKGLFQVLQACVICCYICYAQAEFEALWLLSGVATRLVNPLGLNHLDNWAEITAVDYKPGKSLLAPPIDREEHYERCATFWAVFSIDRHASASTSWSTSIDELDISTQLPCYDAYSTTASLSIRHPNFVHEFAQPVGSLGLYVKAVVLLGRVINFLQRIPRSQELPGKSAIETKREIRASAAFQDLDYALGKFRTATSANVFDGDTIDGHLASAYVIPHTASILLHESFCCISDRSVSSSISKSLTSAKCVVNSTYLLYESSSDLSGCDPFLPFCWGVVGKALVRDYAIKSLLGEEASAIASRTLAEHCLSFTARCAKIRGTNIAKVMTANMRYLLENPDVTLPTI